MENVITLEKLIDLSILFCPSILCLKTPNIQGMSSLALYGNHFSSIQPKRYEEIGRIIVIILVQ